VRPNAIRAGVHYLSHALGIEPGEIRAVVAAFGETQVDEYRIGLSVDPDGDEIAHGIVWPLFGAESEADDPSPLERIREILRDAGATEHRLWPDMNEPEYCEDCGAPLFPSENGEVVHAEMPGDAEPGSSHFHCGAGRSVTAKVRARRSPRGRWRCVHPGRRRRSPGWN